MNKIIIIGRLAANPELKTTQGGISVCSVSIAVNRSFIKNGQRERVCDFFQCVFWRKLAETVCRYCTKGQEIAVFGSMQSRRYADKNGQNHIAWELVVDEIKFCGGKITTESASAPATPAPAAPVPEPNPSEIAPPIPADFEQQNFYEEVPYGDDLPF